MLFISHAPALHAEPRYAMGARQMLDERMNQYRASAPRFKCGMLTRTGSRADMVMKDILSTKDTPRVPLPPAGLAVRSNQTLVSGGPSLEQVGGCMRRGLALPLLGHGSCPLGAGPCSQDLAPRPRLSVGHLMTPAAPLWVLTATPKIQPSYPCPSLRPFPLLCILIKIRKPERPFGRRS